MREKVSICGPAIGILFLLSMVFSPYSLGAPPEKELKVGAIFALSGPGAPWGIGLKTGFEIAFDEINAAGGIKTSKVIYKPKVLAEDDQLKPELAVTRFHKLFYTDKIDPIVYCMAGGVVKALQPLTTPKKILNLFAGQSDYEPQHNPYTFREVTYHYLHQQVSFQWFKKNLPAIKRVILLNPDYTSGHDASRVFRPIAKRYDFAIISDDYFPLATTDFNPILTKLLPKKPDLLHIGCTAPGSAALIVKQARELGFTGPIYGSTKQDTRTVLEVAGNYSDNFFTNTLVYGAPRVPKNFNAFYEECMKRHGKYFDVAPQSHRTAYVIKAAIEAIDGLNPERLGEAYRKVRIDSIEGPTHYGPPFGTEVYYPVPMTKIEKGKAIMPGLFDAEILTEAEYLGKP